MKMVVQTMNGVRLYVPEASVPFSLTCLTCDAGMDVTDRADAETKGWTDIEYDDGLSWNFVGLCPNCKRAETIEAGLFGQETRSEP